MGLYPAHRALTLSSVILCGLCGLRSFNHREHRGAQRNSSRTPAGTFQALIKIYIRLVVAQSIQLSNIVLGEPSLVVGHWPLGQNLQPSTLTYPREQVWVLLTSDHARV